MHLFSSDFSSDTGPYMSHFHVTHSGDRVELEWQVCDADELRWRVLRSEHGFAEQAEPPGPDGQVRVSESRDTHFSDGGLDPQVTYFYTVFAQGPDGVWQRQVEAKVTPHALFRWSHAHAQEVADVATSLAAQPTPVQPTGRGRFTPLHHDGVDEWLRLGGD